MNKLPCCQPTLRFEEFWPQIAERIHAVIQRGQLILGPEVEGFEREFADYVGTRYAVAVGNGTDAITLALQALDIGSGDEVIVPALTAAGTATGVHGCGASPVFADVCEKTRCLSPESVERVITPRTAAVVAVHLHGHAAPVSDLRQITDKHGLALIEDAAQAHGLIIEGKMAGSFGDMATFSFYPTKNLGATGDGGAVVTNSPTAAERVRSLRCMGWDDSRISQQPGMNSRMDEIHAAVLRILLPRLADYNNRRRAIAETYLKTITQPGVTLPTYNEGSVWHQFAITTPFRREFREQLANQGIMTDIHYPVGLHRMPGFPNADLPVTDRLCEQLVSLPIQPEVVEPNLEQILNALKRMS